MVSTELVLIETANFVAKTQFRTHYSFYTRRLRETILVEKINDSDLALAWSMYDKVSDKAWSMIDCYSFIVMKRHGIQQALTTDKHFEQSGFEILLK